MASRGALERRLAGLAGFERPSAPLEQYVTPAALAAHLVHLADLLGDVSGRTVVDLGTGTGPLALGAALRDPGDVVGIDVDPDALEIARRNEERFDAPVPVSWVCADATAAPVCVDDVTVLMNPPFGAQRAGIHADRSFLDTASRIARVSYSVHNAGSRGFLEAFVADEGGRLSHAFASEIALDRQFPFHEAEREAVGVVVARIVWS